MRLRAWILTGAVAALPLGSVGCVDPDAGPTVYSGKAALQVVLDSTVTQGLPGGPVVGYLHPVLPGDSLRLFLSNLHPLEEGYLYQVWMVEGDPRVSEPRAQRIEVEHILQTQDTIGRDPFTDLPVIDWVDSDPVTTDGFTTGYGNRHILTLRQPEMEAQQVDFFQYSHVVLTVGTEGEDANPFDEGTAAPLFYRFRNPRTGARTPIGDAAFYFDPNDLDREGPPDFAGTGLLEFLNVRGIGLHLNRVTRPPIGHYYEVWIVSDRDETLQRSLGEIRTPAPEYLSLRDADLETGLYVSPTELLRGALWAEWGDIVELGPANPPLERQIRDFTFIQVIVAPKQGVSDVKPSAVIFQALIPPGLIFLPVERISS